MFEVPERFNVGTLIDRNLEAGRGDKVALRSDAGELTYAQIYDRVCRAANALRALGVRREQRVLMILDDTPAFPAVFLGAMRLGAVAAPVSFLDIAANFRHYAQTTSYGFQFSNGTWLNDNISSIAGGGFSQNASTPDFVAPAEADWALCTPNKTLYA